MKYHLYYIASTAGTEAGTNTVESVFMPFSCDDRILAVDRINVNMLSVLILVPMVGPAFIDGPAVVSPPPRPGKTTRLCCIGRQVTYSEVKVAA